MILRVFVSATVWVLAAGAVGAQPPAGRGGRSGAAAQGPHANLQVFQKTSTRPQVTAEQMKR
jgi:hypothetical protein